MNPILFSFEFHFIYGCGYEERFFLCQLRGIDCLLTRLRELALCLRSVCCAHAALRLCVRAQTISVYVSECTSIYNFMYALLYTALAWGQPPGNVSVPCITHAAGFFPPSALALSVPPHAHATSIVDACARVHDESAIAVHRSRHS